MGGLPPRLQRAEKNKDSVFQRATLIYFKSLNCSTTFFKLIKRLIFYDIMLISAHDF